MIVSDDQLAWNTLIGLKKGILLIEAKYKSEEYCQKRLIIPHGKVFRVGDGNGNGLTNVDIEYNSELHPKYFSYKFDDDLKRLKADNSITSWLYLALLHASTSQILADPYLGLTGTEMALELLQSANCWSCRPLPVESKKILEQISNLSPKRYYYPNHMKLMQMTKWPNALQSTCAHEAFSLLTKKILLDSQRLKFAFDLIEDFENKFEESINEAVPKIVYNEILKKRSYHRAAKYYTENQRVDELFPPKSNFVHLVKNEMSTDRIKSIRKIGINHESLKFCENTSKPSNFLWKNLSLEWKNAGTKN
jgi:hypothetical protein